MTTLNNVVNMDWNGDMVSPNKAVGDSGIVNWLTTVIHQIWDAINVNVGELENDDGDYFPTSGCCSF